MSSKVLFAPMAYSRYEATQTLPEKFSRMLKKSGLAVIRLNDGSYTFINEHGDYACDFV